VLGPRLALVAALVACRGEPPPPPTPGSGAVGSGRVEVAPDDPATTAPAATATFCTDEAPVVHEVPGGLEVDTTHYALYAQLDAAEAITIARLLEASSGAFASWFARPAPEQRLVVRVYADRPAYEAALRADGASPHGGAGGFTATHTNISSVLRQSTYDYTRVLAVHEATHQFHQMTRNPPDDMPFWYVEGIAEYLSRHDWDGRCVRLGVNPLVSFDPNHEADGSALDVAAILSTTSERGAAWALIRYLDTNRGLHARFTAYRDAIDAGGSADFSTLVGSPAAMTTPFHAWLATERLPLAQVFFDWASVGPGTVDVRCEPHRESVALVQQRSATHLAARVIGIHGHWSVGVVTSYADNDHHALVLHDDSGKVSLFHVDGDVTWKTLGQAPPPRDGVEDIALDLDGTHARITFNGSAVSVDAPSPRAGLAVYGTSVRFSNVTWR
jgi:hypothetical protein